MKVKKPTIAIIGGSQELTFKKIGKKNDCNISFHGGKTQGGAKKNVFKKVVKKADAIVVLNGACGHIAMELVKDLSKQMNIPIDFIEGFGATGAIKAGLKLIDTDQFQTDAA